MELEDFLKSKGILRIYCENTRAFQKDWMYCGERRAHVGSFEWAKTPQGAEYWRKLKGIHPNYSSNTCDYFANHPILECIPRCIPICLKRL